MFTLKVLGGAAIEGPAGAVAGQPAQKRRVALLALLAMSRQHRLAREKLVAYLWPDREGDGGRRLLSDAIYVLNRALGPDTLSATGDELRLNTAQVACDAREFEAATESDPEAAVRLYHGPFLDGFFLDGCEEFEAWAARERDRLATLLATTLERVAVARDGAGDHRGAAASWRRLAVEDPYNSHVAVQLARAIDRTGDRAGALQSAQGHAAFLRKELGLAAPAELRDLIASFQAEPPGQDPVASPPPRRVPLQGWENRVATPSLASLPLAASPQPAAAPRRLPLVWITAAIVLLAGLVAWLSPWRSPRSAGALQSIAVMPFDDHGDEPSGPYFVEGIADELTTRLGQSSGLKVAARTSAFALKGRQMDAPALGRALNVEALLEGSVRKDRDRIRIAIRLVDTRDGYQVWSDTWDLPLTDVPGVQEQIAGAVVRALRGGGAQAGDAGGPDDNVAPEAYHLYLQGRYLWHQRTRESLARSAETFERAVAIAPTFARGFSGLADAYAVMGFYDYLRPAEAFPRARTAAQRALTLDPDLAHAHASLGYVALYYDWNWAEAERSFTRAIALNPSYSTGRQWYANFLTARGRFDEAVAEMRRARELDPLSLIASGALGWVHFFRRDYGAAAEQCRRTLELNPAFPLAHLWSGWAADAAGDYGRAVTHLTKAVALAPDSAAALASLGRAQALVGRTDAARETLAKLQRTHAQYLPAYELAKLHLALGDHDEAVAWLQRAHAERSHSLVFLHVDPHFDALRSDPRLARVASAVGAPAGQ